MEIEKIEDTGIMSSNLDKTLKLVDIKNKIIDSMYKEAKRNALMSTSEGAYVDPIKPKSLNYKEKYEQAKKTYRRNPSTDCKRDLIETLDRYMDEFTEEMNEMLKDVECKDERDTIQRYINKIRDFR